MDPTPAMAMQMGTRAAWPSRICVVGLIRYRWVGRAGMAMSPMAIRAPPGRPARWAAPVLVSRPWEHGAAALMVLDMPVPMGRPATPVPAQWAWVRSPPRATRARMAKRGCRERRARAEAEAEEQRAD